MNTFKSESSHLNFISSHLILSYLVLYFYLTDSRDEKDPVYSEIPDILPHTYEELDSADIKFNVFYGGRKISDPSRFSNSHYQELDNANGKLNYLYARRSYPDHTYENADAQV